jgi:ornithine cyclodeaminase
MRILDPAQTAALLPYSPLADACAAMLRAKKAGTAHAPERLHLHIGDTDEKDGGVLLVMPASDQRLAITKLVTVHAGNPARGLPTIQGEVVVLDGCTGQRLGILDGPTLTARRTAAVSLLAARLLATKQARQGPLLVVGAGVQARGHLEAMRQGLGVEEALIHSRTRASAERLAAHARRLGMRAEVVERMEEGLERARLVVTATTSVEPVLPDSPPGSPHAPRPGTFIAAIGAYRPHMAEIPPTIMRAARVVADSADALPEAGDFLRAGLGPAEVELLEDVVEASAPPDKARVTIFKGTGHALFDLAAAGLAFPPDR